MKLKRSVSRTIQIKQFEPLMVTMEIEDDIDPSQLVKKAEEFDQICYEQVMRRIAIERPSLVPRTVSSTDRKNASEQATLNAELDTEEL